MSDDLPILITSCSSTRLVAPKVRVEDLPTGLTMAEALQEWNKRLNAEEATLSPRELYRGLGFYTLVKIQEQFPLEGVRIITGGQGLISIDDKIVPYDFSASPKEQHNVLQKVTAEPFVLSVWWRMINTARREQATPISSLVCANPDRYTVIAASKIFLKYVAEDILSIPFEYRHKVRILLAASSIGSVPKQLRPMIIPFDRSFVNDIPGNRNDSNHRAAFKFLEMLQDPEFASWDITQQQVAFESADDTRAMEGRANPEDIEAFLRERPNLLNVPIEEAYKQAGRTLGTLGGRMLFRSIVRKLKGDSIAASAHEVDDAVNILKSMGMSFESAGVTHINEEEEALKAVNIFVKAVKTLNPNVVFVAADVCKWAHEYYKHKGQKVPGIIESPNKLSFTIKANVDNLGLVAAGKGYTIAPDAPMDDPEDDEE